MFTNDFIRQLGSTAEVHAREEHGIVGPMSLTDVDAVLDQLRSSGENATFEAVVPCYGAWFGEHCLAIHGGKWLGMQEPVPPRIEIQGVCYSPMDAVRNRLLTESVCSLVELERRLPRKSEVEVNDWRATNESAWDQLILEPRFHPGVLPDRDDEALSAIDPWIRAEGVVGRELLCLAAGGGLHAPIHAMAGYHVTVVDLSEKALAFDRRIAEQLGLAHIDIFKASMDDLSIFNDASFDIVLHPVSLCYVSEPIAVYRELARILKPGGLYVSQQKSPASLQVTHAILDSGYHLSHLQREEVPLPPGDVSEFQREAGTVEFAHSLDRLLGSLCRSGFVIEDLCEPVRGDFWAPANSAAHRACYLPPYIKIKARKSSQADYLPGSFT